MSASHPLRDWRNSTGEFAGRSSEILNQEDLALLLGVAPSHISQIETGDRKPSLSLAVKLSSLTGISVERFDAFPKAALQAAE